MPHKTARPAGGIPDRAGLNDFRWRAGSEASLHLKSLRAQAQRRLRRQHHVEQVNRLRCRVWFEFVDELVRHHPEIAEDIDRRLERYAGLNPNMLQALSLDRFPPPSLRVVRGAR